MDNGVFIDCFLFCLQFSLYCTSIICIYVCALDAFVVASYVQYVYHHRASKMSARSVLDQARTAIVILLVNDDDHTYVVSAFIMIGR